MCKSSDTFRRVHLAATRAAVLAIVAGCGPNADHVALPAIEGKTRTLAFSSNDEGSVPSAWVVERTGSGEGSTWQVVADESSPSGTGYVLAQTAESPRSMFNLCVVEESRYTDLRLRVAFKAVEGEVDQGGGLVWRYVDANNYYVCRFNPLEDNLRIYKVIAGKRQQLASVDAELPAGHWHTLTGTMQGSLIVCDVDGAQLNVRDDTLKDAGRIGLWTKADARTFFDALSVTGIEGSGTKEQ